MAQRPEQLQRHLWSLGRRGWCRWILRPATLRRGQPGDTERKAWSVGGETHTGTPLREEIGTGSSLRYNAKFDSTDAHRESNATQGEGYRGFLKQQAEEDFALYDRYGTADAIAAETNRQAEAWVAQAAGQIDRAATDQNPNENTEAQNVEDMVDQVVEKTKAAAEAVRDAFKAAGDAAVEKVREVHNAMGEYIGDTINDENAGRAFIEFAMNLGNGINAAEDKIRDTYNASEDKISDAYNAAGDKLEDFWDDYWGDNE